MVKKYSVSREDRLSKVADTVTIPDLEDIAGVAIDFIADKKGKDKEEVFELLEKKAKELTVELVESAEEYDFFQMIVLTSFVAENLIVSVFGNIENLVGLMGESID